MVLDERLLPSGWDLLGKTGGDEERDAQGSDGRGHDGPDALLLPALQEPLSSRVPPRLSRSS